MEQVADLVPTSCGRTPPCGAPGGAGQAPQGVTLMTRLPPAELKAAL